MKVVVAITSYPKRINNVKKVLENILSNTRPPDVILLTLSTEEFVNREQDLPSDLVQFINEHEHIAIKWVDDNTKTMKKVFPILKYLDDDDLIMTWDDDFLPPNTVIESRVNDFLYYGGNHAVSGSIKHTVNLEDMYTNTVTSIFQKKMLKNWEKIVDETIINTYNDDRTYLWLMYLNGYKNKPCRSWSVYEIQTLNKYNDVSSSHDSKLYLVGFEYDAVMIKHLQKITHKIYPENMFGWLKRFN
jgi:hypothetical protein